MGHVREWRENVACERMEWERRESECEGEARKFVR